MKRLIAAIALLTGGLLHAPAVLAQTTTVNHLTLNQWVQSTESGSLKGRVVLPQAGGEVRAVADATVAMLGRDGDVLAAKSGETGEFEIAGVQPGVYALTARADNIFACCAMHVIDSKTSKNGKFPRSAEIAVANVDYTVVNTAVIRYVPPGAKSDILSIGDAQLDRLSERVCGEDLFRVAQTNGGMKGRLHVAGARGSDLPGANLTNVFLFENGMEIARALTDDQGRFEFKRVDAGQYSLLSVGPGGLGLIGFELVDESELETAQVTATGNEQLVGLRHRGRCCQEFAMHVAPMPEVVTCVEEVVIAETVIDPCGCESGCGLCEGEIIAGEMVLDGFGTPLAGGGYAPGYGGGGGGFYGGGGGGGGGLGGGLGGIAALAGIGGIIAATTSDDDNAILPPVVASPAIPAN